MSFTNTNYLDHNNDHHFSSLLPFSSLSSLPYVREPDLAMMSSTRTALNLGCDERYRFETVSWSPCGLGGLEVSAVDLG